MILNGKNFAIEFATEEKRERTRTTACFFYIFTDRDDDDDDDDDWAIFTLVDLKLIIHVEEEEKIPNIKQNISYSDKFLSIAIMNILKYNQFPQL